MIDSHCHLADEVFGADLDQVVQRAKAAGLEGALVILAAGDTGESARAARVEALWPDVRVAVGVHPHAARAFAEASQSAAEVVRAQFATTPLARAIGEIGLDYHYDFSPREVQREVFRAQLRLARELSRPVVIHSREADVDTIEILRQEGGGQLEGVLHCFTGDASFARSGLDLGFYISLAGIITFPKAVALREAARLVPLDRLLAETDSPFLAPVPFRGQRNEPAYVTRIVATLSEVHHVESKALAQRISTNFHTLFRP